MMILRPVARVALRPADDELARRVDVEVRVVAVERDGLVAVLERDLVERRLDDVRLDELVHLLHRRSDALAAARLLLARRLARLRVLRRDDDGVDLERLDRAISLLQVLDRHLRLAVRAEPPELAVLAHVRELLAEARRDE